MLGHPWLIDVKGNWNGLGGLGFANQLQPDFVVHLVPLHAVNILAASNKVIPSIPASFGLGNNVIDVQL